jgi:hypothetical protein
MGQQQASIPGNEWLVSFAPSLNGTEKYKIWVMMSP